MLFTPFLKVEVSSEAAKLRAILPPSTEVHAKTFRFILEELCGAVLCFFLIFLKEVSVYFRCSGERCNATLP